MRKVNMINISARDKTPDTKIYSEVYTKTRQLGQRNVLIFIPGGPGNDHTSCDYGNISFAESLLPFADIILFDPRGCGNSEKSAVEFCTLEHYIDDIEAIRSHYHLLPEQSILLGSSYGAIAALGYVIKYPTKFKKLILVNAAANGDFLNDAQQNLHRSGNAAQIRMGEQVLAGNFPFTSDFVAEYYETMGPLYSTSFKPNQPTPSLTFNADLINLGFKDFLRNFDYRPQLSNINCETLIITGESDWIFDKKQAELIHNQIPRSKLHLYKNCGHMVLLDQWDKFFADTIDFIQQ